MLLNRLTKKAQLVLEDASKASYNNKVSVGSVIAAIEGSTGVANKLLKKIAAVEIDRSKTVNLNRLVEEAFYQSVKFNHAYVGTEHLLLAVFHIAHSPQTELVKSEVLKLNTFPHNIRNFDTSSKKTPILDTFGVVISPKEDVYTVSRDEVDNMISVLLQRKNPNPLLVGDAGVGKDSLVRLLARRIFALDVPVALMGYKVLEFDLLAFIASLSNKESLEFGLTSLLEELTFTDKTILYIKNFQNLFVAVSGGVTIPLAFSMFKSDMSMANVRMIATITAGLFDRIASENDHVLAGFDVIDVSEPSEKKTREILFSAASGFESFHGIKIAKETVSYAYSKAKKDITSIKFPQKGVNLLDKACSCLLLKSNTVTEKMKLLVKEQQFLIKDVKANLETGSIDKAVSARNRLSLVGKRIASLERRIATNTSRVLTVADVDAALQNMGIEPLLLAQKMETTLLSNLADKIRTKIIGQDDAVDAITKALIRARLGLRSTKRPLGNFLLLGPTGVGKTELAKVLAAKAFGEDKLIRLDMSDFGEKHTVARLVGAPPGYVGYGEAGDLTGRIDTNPDSVVLFDEIEKAHPDVLNILLQIMEEGELADAKGNIFDFSRAVIILTSNMGTEILQKKEIGFGDDNKSESKAEKRLRENMKKILKPELINRFDEIVVFKKLGKSAQLKIVNLMLIDVKKTLKEQDIALEIAAGVKSFLLANGYSEEYGARALRRTVETHLLDKIAEVLLKETARPLSLVAVVRGKGGDIEILHKNKKSA